MTSSQPLQPVSNKEDMVMSDIANVKELSPETKASLEIGDEIQKSLTLLLRYTEMNEKRFVSRALRLLLQYRSRLSLSSILQSMQSAVLLSENDTFANYLINFLKSESASEMTDIISATTSNKTTTLKKPILTPEVELYFGLMISIKLLDFERYSEGALLTAYLVHRVLDLNLRSLDPISAKIYFYYSRFFELMDNGAHYGSIRSQLLASHQSSILRKDVESQAVLINLILRNYIGHQLFDLAEKFAMKITFPNHADNNQMARYMYYLGRIQAIRLNYSEANHMLDQAMRKAPQGSTAAIGFRQTAHKLSILVRLLMGDIPERSLLRQSMLRHSLTPYFHLTQAVRRGDLTRFQQICTDYESSFQKDQNYTLVLRLRHNVIKTGLKLVNTAYSQIHFKDVCDKLHLGSPEDAEYIVIKTIKDGVIDATVDIENSIMRSNETQDIYMTTDPQISLEKRIQLCLQFHDDALQALRYPDSSSAGGSSGDGSHDKEKGNRRRRRAKLDFSKPLRKEEDEKEKDGKSKTDQDDEETEDGIDHDDGDEEGEDGDDPMDL